MIDIIVPVYRGAAATRRCLESVLANVQDGQASIVVVDDASPEADVVAYVDSLAASRRIELIRNERNEGFVRAVNLGMARHIDRDVVLLNSDAEVANDWLGRLASCAARDATVGTVTPFSNNATICSYPFEGWTGDTPGTLGLAALDRLFAFVNAGRCGDLPTAVGFCMYIRRACFEAVGPFDDERFGRGYGEENDFCLRAAQAGWRNVLAADVFVFHEGAVSFTDERDALMRAAERSLVERHPDYPSKVAAFVAADPLRDFRAAIDNARRAQSAVEAEQVYLERVSESHALRMRVASASADFAALTRETAALGAGLAHAESLVRARDAEIARLTSAFAHAEALALERGRQLARIDRSMLGKLARYLVREKPR